MILPPFDVDTATDAELIRWYVQEQGETLEEARATVEILRDDSLQEGLD
jgi:hypothetical protein